MDVLHEAALWMLDQVRTSGILYQEEAVWDVERKFGASCVKENDAGNLAFEKKLLSAFRKISEEEVVWDRSEKCWRRREITDGPGRQQI